MSAYSRLRYVIAANVNALIEKAEDPEKLLRALIREMEDASEEAREACAELLAGEQQLERRIAELDQEIERWQSRAERAVTEDRDDLARAALQTRSELAAQRDSARRELGAVVERKGQMEQDMETLKAKLEDAKAKLKDRYAEPYGGAERAGATPLRTPGERRMRQALSRFDRLQTQVENLEARVRSYEFGGMPASRWDQETIDPRVEEELRRLKERMSEGAPETGQAAESESGREA